MSEVHLEPMTWADFDPWVERSVRGFAAQLVAAGVCGEHDATAYAEQQLAALLPDGLATLSQLLATVRVADGSTVGHLWLRIRPGDGEVEAYVVDVEILPRLRGRGLGRAAMRAAESAARDLGATVVRLNVFAHNAPAVGLYTSLGYAGVHATVTKDLSLTAGTGREAPVVELRGMSRAELATARAALDRVRRERALVDGVPSAEVDLDRLVEGPTATGHRLWTACCEGFAVGWVWALLQPRPAGSPACQVLDLQVRPDLQGRGYEEATLAAVEDTCRQLGVTTVTASLAGAPAVPGHVYERRGFSLTALTMAKDL